MIRRILIASVFALSLCGAMGRPALAKATT